MVIDLVPIFKYRVTMNIPGVINYEHVQVHTVYIFEIETEFIHYPGIKCVVLFIVLMVPLIRFYIDRTSYFLLILF